MEKQISEFRIVAYFRSVYPSPTQYKRKIYKTIEQANNEFPDALNFYTQHQYKKHLECVQIQERLVTEWRFIKGVDEETEEEG